MRIHPFFKNRYIPNIEWSGGKLITHDVFRLFERIFGRDFGIRAEASVSARRVGGKVVEYHEFYTVEALLTHIECATRKYLKSFEFGFEFVELPVFQLVGLFPQQSESVRIPIFKFAIANTSTVANGFTANGTTCTMSLTTSGSDRCVIAAVWTWNASNTYTSTTYAGTAMTELVSRAADGTGSNIRLVGAHNATTGTNNVVSNTSGNMQHINTAASYSGVKSDSAANAFPDTETDGTSSGTSITTTMTTSVDDSWVFCHARTPSKDMSAGTNTTERCQSSISGDAANLFDSNAARASGSNSLQYTWSGTQTSYWVMGSMAPAASAVNVTVSAGVNTGTFSIPTYTAKTNLTQTITTLVATFSIPVYTVLSGAALFTASVVSATFSIPTYVAKASANAYANTLSATFSVITYAVALGARVLQATLSATFTTVVLTKAGSIWTKIARNSTGIWTRSDRNND